MRKKLARNTLQARVLQAPRLRTIRAVQEMELLKLPPKERQTLRRKGFSTTPIRGSDFSAVKFRGTEVPVTPRGVNISRQQLGTRSLRGTLRHEIGHQRLFAAGVPVRKHHRLLK
jgi:hypothetical protein